MRSWKCKETISSKKVKVVLDSILNKIAIYFHSVDLPIFYMI